MFSPVNDSPDDKYLNKYVREKVSAAGTNKWRDLGVELMEQCDVNVLDAIKSNSNDNSECCSKMFTLWRQRTPKISWKQLIEALKEIHLTQLASEIEKLLLPSVEHCVEQEITRPLEQCLKRQQESEGMVALNVASESALSLVPF